MKICVEKGMKQEQTYEHGKMCEPKKISVDILDVREDQHSGIRGT